MKRLALLLVVFTLSAGLIIGSAAALAGSQDKVEVLEQVIAGSRDAAKGLKVEFHSTDGAEKLFWDTKFEIDGDKIRPESAFEYEPDRPDLYRTFVTMGLYRYDLSITGTGDLLNGDITFYYGRAGLILYKMAQDVAKRTDNCTRRVETLKLRDYVEYFDWELTGDLENCILNLTDKERRELGELFKVQVPEDYYMRVRVDRDDRYRVRKIVIGESDGFHEATVEKLVISGDGLITNTENVKPEEVNISIKPLTCAAPGDGGIWVYPSVKDKTGREMVEYADGSGLYFIPVREGIVLPDTESARCVYPTCEEPVHISVSGGNVELVTRSGDAFLLTVIDGKSGEVRDRLTLFEYAGDGLFDVVEKDGLRLYVLTDGRFALTVCEGDATSVGLEGRFDLDSPFFTYGYPLTLSNVISGSYSDIAWDGERLALANGRLQEVVVADESGVIYHARFNYSTLWNGRDEYSQYGGGSPDYYYLKAMTVEFE